MNVGAFQKATELHKRLLVHPGRDGRLPARHLHPDPRHRPAAFANAFEGQSKGILGMFNMFSGGAVQRMAIFALNVMPYISASIIVQLLGTIYPPWEKLRKEGGEAGRKQLNQYTRYLTVLLAIFQSFGIAIGLSNSQGVGRSTRASFFILSTVVTLTTGTMFLMWLGEQITSRGVGNGVSLIIFAGIVARLPTGGCASCLAGARRLGISGFMLLRHRGLAVGVIVFIVFMERSQRRLLVHYPKRQVGNRMFGGETSLPAAEDQRLRRDPADLRLVAAAAAGLRADQLPRPMPTCRTGCSGCRGVGGQLQHGQPVFMVALRR